MRRSISRIAQASLPQVFNSLREHLRVPPAFRLATRCSSLRNPTVKLIMTTPPFRASARSMSSVMLRGWFERARQDECEAMTGALVTSRAS